MTTVVLTPTHMASDHCVVRRGFPSETSVSLDNQKIFISPKKTMMIGAAGALNAAEVNHPNTWEVLGLILTYYLAQIAENGLDSGGTYLDDDRVPMKNYAAVLDPDGTTFLVTRRYRFAITSRGGSFYIKELNSYAGIGTGGMYAAGLCAGGMNIHDIWPTVHKFDHLSSVEHTVIPISSLKLTPKLDASMRTVRDKILGVEGAKQ